MLQLSIWSTAHCYKFTSSVQVYLWDASFTLSVSMSTLVLRQPLLATLLSFSPCSMSSVSSPVLRLTPRLCSSDLPTLSEEKWIRVTRVGNVGRVTYLLENVREQFDVEVDSHHDKKQPVSEANIVLEELKSSLGERRWDCPQVVGPQSSAQ